MGKQLYFAHTEDDIYQFLCFLDKLNISIIIDNWECNPLKVHASIINDMRIYGNSQYKLVPVSSNSSIKTANEASIAEGTAIELLNCWKWDSESCVYYDKGRIYLAKTKTGEYDAYMLTLYNRICSYIKRKYVFYKHLGIYFSYDFKSKYDLKEVFISQLGQPISFH